MAWDELKQAELNAAWNDMQTIPHRLRILRAEIAALEKQHAKAKEIVDRARKEANDGI